MVGGESGGGSAGGGGGGAGLAKSPARHLRGGGTKREGLERERRVRERVSLRFWWVKRVADRMTTVGG